MYSRSASLAVVAILIIAAVSVTESKVMAADYSGAVSTKTATSGHRSDPAPVPSIDRFRSSSRASTCCYIDGCTKVHSCFPAGAFFTDGCARTYDIASDCSIKRKTCCYKDACNKSHICFDAITYFKDSCGNGYIVNANCRLSAAW